MSFSHLATVGTLSYNGYTFDGASSVKVDVRHVKDDAERTVIYNEHTIEVRAFVSGSTGSTATDISLENIRYRLGHQGQQLTFTNRGFGRDLIVNRPSGIGIRDVKWGPCPEILHWEPVGAGNACEIVWKVRVCVPVCGGGAFDRTSGIMAHNYGITITIDERGLSTRTISGYIEIAQTRASIAGINAKNVPDSADNYRDFIQPDKPLGFQRVAQTWETSPDKSRATYTITDKQIPSKTPWPVGVTNIRLSHRSAWTRQRRQTNQLRQTITMDVELALGAPQALGFVQFGNFIKARTDIASRNGFTPLLDELIVEEDVFGLSQSFAASYRLLTDIGNVINQGSANPANQTISSNFFNPALTGMWTPVNNDWRLWRNSISNVESNRGLAGLLVLPQNDVIIDLCGPGFTISSNATLPPPSQRVSINTPTLTNPRPPPRRSFLEYRVRMAIRRSKYAARQKIKQQTREENNAADGFSTTPMDFTPGGAQPGQGTGFQTSFQDVIQTSGPSSYDVVFVGTAIRAGYEITRPSISSFYGITPVETDGVFVTEQLGAWFGLPIFKAQFALNYMIPTSPGTIHPPPKLEA